MEGQIGSWDYNWGVARASSESSSTLVSGYHYMDGLKAALGSGLINPFLMPGQAQSAEGMAALQAASAAGVEAVVSNICEAAEAFTLGY